MNRENTDTVTVGLALVRPTHQLGEEPFYHEFIAGIERIFSTHGISLLLQIVEDDRAEVATYDRWSTGRSVQAIFLTDLRGDDARVSMIDDLHMPAVVIGDPESAGALSSVWTEDASSMGVAVDELHALGHRVLGRVSGPRSLAHSAIRSRAFLQSCRALNLSACEEEADYSEHGGRVATRELLNRPTPPTAIIFDDDLMAIGGLQEVEARALVVPRDISMLAWDDSVLCQLASPPLSVMGHDVQALGELAGATMIDTINGREPTRRQGAVARFIARGSVGAAPGVVTTS